MPSLVQLTAPGRGAVATLLIEGPGARDAVAAHFRASGGRPLAAYPADRPVFGRFGPDPGEEVVVHAASDDAVEVHCHGGHAAVARLSEILVAAGCRKLDWRAWARRHHEDPITAEASIALADARTERTATILLDQYHGALRRAVDRIRELLGEGDLTAARRQIKALLDRGSLGRHLASPWQVVLAGPPNAGKSSLINALVGYQRAIVHAAPGTTRDAVTAATAMEGWAVELCDTAGFRSGELPVEQAGIALARERLAAADLAILVFDAGRPWSETDAALLRLRSDALVVHNKCDLPPDTTAARPAGLETSALYGDGIEALVAAIARRLVPAPPPPGAAVPFTAEQIDALRAAEAAMVRGEPPVAEALLSCFFTRRQEESITRGNAR